MPRRPFFLILFLVAEWLQPASQLNIGKKNGCLEKSLCWPTLQKKVSDIPGGNNLIIPGQG
jgi:hypothetical protein